MIDFAKISNAIYKSRYSAGSRRRDGKPSKSRADAHAVFDKIWKSGVMSRADAYRWLAFQMGWPEADAHMGMMNAAECQKVIRLSKRLLAEGYKSGDLAISKRRKPKGRR